MTDDWPFADPRNVATLTVQAVLDGAPILLVTHDADDGGWQFHSGGNANVEDGRVVSLQSIYELDPTVGELADLPLGSRAWRESRGDSWTRVQADNEPEGFLCASCGQEHDASALDYGYRRPDAFLRVPENERDDRCQSTDDLCAIDDARFFLRGVLALPLTDIDDHAGLGVWAEVSRASFARYRELYDDASQGDEPPPSGTVATSLPGFDETEGVQVEVSLVSPTERLSLKIADAHHWLARRQVAGITRQDWFAMLHQLDQ